MQKAFYLPEAHTDMIAAVIGEELGLVGIAMLVGLYGMFGYAGFRTAQRARDRYGKLLAAGMTSLVLVQAVINLFAVLGLAPLTGVPLPFVSYGNSSLLVMLAARRPAAQRRQRRHRRDPCDHHPRHRRREARRCETARRRRRPADQKGRPEEGLEEPWQGS